MFRIDLLDPTTRRKAGNFPITTATRVSRQEGLDRIGKWSFDVSVTDPALPDIEGKEFAVYWLRGTEAVFLGECSYLDHQVDAGRTVRVTAAGRLRDLQRQTVLQRSFDGALHTINDALAAIVPLRAGWSLGAVDTVAKPAPLDFWYETIFDSVALLASTFGLHFREGSAPRTLDFGAMGADSGVLAVGGEELPLAPELYANPGLALVSSLSVAYQSSTIVNRLIPFGGAVGVATIGLGETTVTQLGYPVWGAALPGGGLYHYLEDADSIARYGLSERRFLRKDLRPISNSPAAREFAANVLYEAALASLLNLKDRQTIYEVTVANWTPGRVRVGDKIRLRYRGVVETRAGRQVWLDIDDAGQGKAFYVLEINESFGDGVTAQLKISEKALHEETVEDLLAGTIRAFEGSQIHVQPTISRYTVGPYTKRASASPSVSASFSFKLGPETLNVWYVKLQVSGEPLKSSIQSVAAESVTTPAGGGGTTPSGGGGTTPGGGGTTSQNQDQGHTHGVQIVQNSTPGTAVQFVPTGGLGGYLRISGSGSTLVAQTSDVSQGHTHSVPDHTHSTPNHTHSIPDHQHTFTPTLTATYGIYEDNVRPDSLTILVNGTIAASGVTLSAGNNYTYELDITSQVLAAAALQQEHTITVEVGAGRGEIVFQAQVLAVIQGIAV